MPLRRHLRHHTLTHRSNPQVGPGGCFQQLLTRLIGTTCQRGSHACSGKADAVALYRSRPGATIKSVATDLGVNTETLRKWIRAADGRRPGSHSEAGATATAPAGDSAEAELAAARKRIRELEEERDILRKAARYFATETRW